MNKTTHYNLNKPLPADLYEIAPLNQNADLIDAGLQTAQTTASAAQTAAGAAQTTANAAQTTANAAKTTASAAMPKAGGTMTGNLVAYSTNRSGLTLRNCEVQRADGTQPSSSHLIFRRK